MMNGSPGSDQKQGDLSVSILRHPHIDVSSRVIPGIENEFFSPAILCGLNNGIKGRSSLILIASVGALQRPISFSEQNLLALTATFHRLSCDPKSIQQMRYYLSIPAPEIVSTSAEFSPAFLNGHFADNNSKNQTKSSYCLNSAHPFIPSALRERVGVVVERIEKTAHHPVSLSQEREQNVIN